MSEHDIIKLPRLYVDQELTENGNVTLSEAQNHYLKNVLRRKAGDRVRLFNGRHGEWLATLDPAKTKALVTKQIRPQPETGRTVTLVFAPIKKARMDWLVEKAVELGATHFRPVLTQNTEIRKIKAERIQQQIIEASEQCERLDRPALSEITTLEKLLAAWDENTPLLACLEREDAQHITEAIPDGNVAFLIGPEGGFTKEEKAVLHQSGKTIPVSLGPNILRVETAVCYALSHC